jgi:hypothetical protein
VFARLLTAAVLAALVVPGVAQAHHTAVPVVALDYGNRIVSGGAGLAGVHASVVDAGRKLQLTVAPGHEVTVLGYENELFLIFDRDGVRANEKSQTAKALRLVSGPYPTALGWAPVTRSHTFAWADSRVWAPASALHGKDVVHWSVPVLANGKLTSIRGELTKASKPPIWPWLVLGLLPLVATAVAVRRKRWLWAGAAGLAALAGLATVANLGGFATGGLSISADRWTLLAVEVTLTVVALGLLTRPRARLIAVAALAAFAVLQALSELSVFRHGIVVSSLPGTAVRTAAALALGAGIGAAALVFLAPVPETRTSFSNVRRPRKEQA